MRTRPLLLCLATTLACVAAPLPHALHGAPEAQAAASDLARGPTQRAPGSLLAGAAKVDITPMAGMPLGGHAIEGGTGYALWTRLWARAIYFEDSEGEALVLVATDLWSMPAGLADEVVERVREDHGLTDLGRAQVLLSATHTHHSPSNYGSSYMYNRAASNAGGYDPALRAFLARAIARAIAEAAASKEPASVHHSAAAVAGVARNRSLPPFLENPEAPEILAVNAKAQLPTCPDSPREVEGVDPCHAVDPTLTTLRIDDAGGEPLAVAAFFAAHPTTMRNYTHAYSGDFFGLATARAEAALASARAEGSDLGDPVVALFNGPQGDVSPNWAEQGRPAALTLGERMAAALVSAAGLTEAGDSPRGVTIEGTIASAFTREPLADREVAAVPGARTARRALPGRSLLSGAEDGPTRFRARVPEGQTVRRHRRPGQGPKKPAVPPALLHMVFPRGSVPTVAPLSIHHLGPLTFAGLPGEFTTTMGMRIRVALAQAYADTGTDGRAELRPVLVGLAGEYLSYFVTPHEYALQHYEGGSTLWGQYAGALIAQAYAQLSAQAPRTDGPLPHPGAGPRSVERRGPARSFALSASPSTRRQLARLPEELREQLDMDGAPAAAWTFRTAAPTWDGPTWPRFAVELLEPSSDPGGPGDGAPRWRPLTAGVYARAVDERSEDFVIFPSEVDEREWTWTLWWLGGLLDGEALAGERLLLRLRADGPGGEHLCSATFEAGALPESSPLLPTAPCVDAYAPQVRPEDGMGVVPAAPR